MQFKRILLLALIVGTALGQQWNRPTIDNISVRGEPALRRATCQGSSYGYLHIGERTKLTATEIGAYILADSSDGKVLTIYPESKSGLFVYADCQKTTASGSQ